MNIELSDLPEKPLFPSCYRVIPSDRNKLYFYSAGRSLVMSGDDITLTVIHLIKLLDGDRQISEILANFDEQHQNLVRKSLHKLNDMGLLIEGLPDLAEFMDIEYEEYIAEIGFLSRYLQNPYQALSSLREATVKVLGANGIALQVITDLAHAGVGNIMLADQWSVELQDIFYSDIDKKRQAIGNNRAEFMASELNPRYPRTAIDYSPELPIGVEECKGYISGGDLIVACLESEDLILLEWLNSACVELGVPLIRAEIMGSRALLGPTVIPGKTACFKCYQLRRMSNQDNLDDHSTISDYLQQYRQHRPNDGYISPISTILGGYAAVEALKYITKFAKPATYNNVVEIDFMNIENSFHPILKLPRCPVCSSLTDNPLVKMWFEVGQ